MVSNSTLTQLDRQLTILLRTLGLIKTPSESTGEACLFLGLLGFFLFSSFFSFSISSFSLLIFSLFLIYISEIKYMKIRFVLAQTFQIVSNGHLCFSNRFDSTSLFITFVGEPQWIKNHIIIIGLGLYTYIHTPFLSQCVPVDLGW